MERGEKGAGINEECGGGGGGGGEEEQKELLGVKLRKGISAGRRGGTSTPVLTWKVNEDDHRVKNRDSSGGDHRRSTSNSLTAAAAAANTAVSARKLGANLWEIQDLLAVSSMSRRDGGRGRHRHRKGGIDPDLSDFSPIHPRDRTRSTGINGWLGAESPASYSSSMKIAAYNQATSPTSSLGYKGNARPPGYNLNTSTELLKVLNRIWSLEEQHTSDMAIVRGLKRELENARAHIQELVEERKVDQREIDGLLKMLSENNVARKSMEREKIEAAVKFAKDEVEGERKLRKHSEIMQHKLVKEFTDVKSLYSKALLDLRRERKVRCLLEDLCDEFAKEVGEYEQEVRELKQKPELDFVHRSDRLIVHVSEAWLDERHQMKIAQNRGDATEVNTIVDRLGCEIESFLQARRSSAYSNVVAKNHDDNYIRRQSLESLHTNGANSAPQDAEDDDSTASDLHCLGLERSSQFGRRSLKNNTNNVTEEPYSMKSDSSKNKFRYAKRKTGRSSTGSKECCLHYRGESEVHPNHFDFREVESSEQWNEKNGSIPLPENSSKDQVEHSNCCKDPETDFSWRGHSSSVNLETPTGDVLHSSSSPMQQWKYRNMSPYPNISESSSKLSHGMKGNTLKSKLLEARLEGQNARLRTSKGVSFC